MEVTWLRLRKCQDLPALENEGGDAEDLSLSRWSLSSAETGAAELLRDTNTHRMKTQLETE